MSALREDMWHWRKRRWLAPDAHWCMDWDGLPVDSMSPEYDCCVCHGKTRLGRLCNWLFMAWFNYQARRAN